MLLGLSRLMLLIAVGFYPTVHAESPCAAPFDFTAPRLHSSETVEFCSAFRDKVLLVVNTASQCGFTPQFESLETLYKKYRERGFEIVGFPSDDFRQELDDEAEIADVCYVNYGVTFTMLGASRVRGDQANSFYRWLIGASGQSPRWNFNKYLLARDGQLIGYYGSSAAPLNGELEAMIQQALDG